MEQLIYWVLGALVTLAVVLFGVAHTGIMGRLKGIEDRIHRIEDILLARPTKSDSA